MKLKPYESVIHIDSRPGKSYVESRGEVLPIVQYFDAAGRQMLVTRRADIASVARVVAGKGARWVSVNVTTGELKPQ